MAEIKGICNEKFGRVRETPEKNLESGADIGASAAVFIDGDRWWIFGAVILTKRKPARGKATRSSTLFRPRKR